MDLRLRLAIVLILAHCIEKPKEQGTTFEANSSYYL